MALLRDGRSVPAALLTLGRLATLIMATGIVLPWAPGAAAADEPITTYEIQATLDPGSHRVTVHEVVRWRNPGSEPVNELWLDLHLKAFDSRQTSLAHELARLDAGVPVDPDLRDIARQITGNRDAGDRAPSRMRITRLEDETGTGLLSALEPAWPDDANHDDCTTARLPLPSPVQPTGSVTLTIQLELDLPPLSYRSGYLGDLHLAARWYPRVAVFEPAGVRGRETGGWRAHQYHAGGGQYAEHATYDVLLRVPRGWLVVATGVEVYRAPDENGLDQVRFRATDVPELAWAAAPPDLMEQVDADLDPSRDVPHAWLEDAARLLELSPAELELPPTHLRLLLPRSRPELAAQILQAARRALVWNGLRYGPYPYPQLTVVSPPAGGGQSQGQPPSCFDAAYPTLIVAGAGPAAGALLPAADTHIEAQIANAVARQYLGSVVAIDELEEAWLVEGLSEYSEREYLSAIRKLDRPDEPNGDDPWMTLRSELARQDLVTSPDRPVWRFRTATGLAAGTRARPALALRTVRGIAGPGCTARGLRRWIERFSGGHPSGSELTATLEEACGQDLGWLMDQIIHGEAVPDWSVLDVEQHRRDDGSWQAAIDLGRPGTLVGPVELELSFADGSARRLHCEVLDRWERLTVEADSRLERVVVDPDGVWALETRRADNTWQAGGPSGAGPVWWLATLLRAVHGLGLPWS